jgi:hypothetical protein
MTDISLTANSAYDPQMMAIVRQQKLAEMLSQMGAQEQAVSTAGGITAPMSPMGALARGLTSFGGSYLAGQAENKANAYENSKLYDALRLRMANSGVDPNTIPSAASTPTAPGFLDRAANFLGIGGNQEKTTTAVPASPANAPTAAPVDAEGPPTGTYMLPPTPPRAPLSNADGTPTSSYMPPQQVASPNAAPVSPNAPSVSPNAPSVSPNAPSVSPFLATLDKKVKYLNSYIPTSQQSKLDQQTALINLQQTRTDYLNNLPRYQALIAAAPPENRPQLLAALNTNNTALLDKYEGTQLDKATAQVTLPPKLNPLDQMKYDAEMLWIAAAPPGKPRTPQDYDAMGEAAKEEALLPFKVRLARDRASANLEASQNLISSNPDAINLGASYFIANGGKYPPNARSAGMQLAIASEAKRQMDALGINMTDLVNKGIGLGATRAAAGSVATSNAQTSVNEGTVNNSIDIVRRLLPTAASRGSFTDINQLGQSLSRKTNDPNSVLLQNGINAISSEYARVMTGTTGGTPSSDAARREAGNRILVGYNKGTIDAAMTQLQQEMAGRSNSQANVLSNLTGGQYIPPSVPFNHDKGAAAPGGAMAPGPGAGGGKTKTGVGFKILGP